MLTFQKYPCAVVSASGMAPRIYERGEYYDFVIRVVLKDPKILDITEGDLEIIMNYSPTNICSQELIQYQKQRPDLKITLKFSQFYKPDQYGNEEMLLQLSQEINDLSPIYGQNDWKRLKYLLDRAENGNGEAHWTDDLYKRQQLDVNVNAMWKEFKLRSSQT